MSTGSGTAGTGNNLPLPPGVASVPDELLRSFAHTKRVGNYLVGRTVGEGSFAKVKEGLHVLTGEKVAIKVIDKKKAKEDPYVRKNMRREGRLLQQVRHRHVIQLFELMETENSYYLVTEFCGGGDLMSRICARRRLQEPEARRYIRQIVSAVDYLHQGGILHRDLKVENLLLDENKDIKIIDFGLSNCVRLGQQKEDGVDAVIVGGGGGGRVGEGGSGGGGKEDDSSSRGISDEMCSTQCGSPAYAAPELLSNSKYGPKVDVWSIGVNMYAMLAGTLPYTVEPFTIKALHKKMINNEMNPLPEHLSEECKNLLHRFLTADPDKRITLREAMQDFWLTDGQTRPMHPVPFPNRLQAVDLNQGLLKHMAQRLEFRLGEVLRLVTSNAPCSATATYHLLARKLARFRAREAAAAAAAAVVVPQQTQQRSSDTTLMRHSHVSVTGVQRSNTVVAQNNRHNKEQQININNNGENVRHNNNNRPEGRQPPHRTLSEDLVIQHGQLTIKPTTMSAALRQSIPTDNINLDDAICSGPGKPASGTILGEPAAQKFQIVSSGFCDGDDDDVPIEDDETAELDFRSPLKLAAFTQEVVRLTANNRGLRGGDCQGLFSDEAVLCDTDRSASENLDSNVNESQTTGEGSLAMREDLHELQALADYRNVDNSQVVLQTSQEVDVSRTNQRLGVSMTSSDSPDESRAMHKIVVRVTSLPDSTKTEKILTGRTEMTSPIADIHSSTLTEDSKTLKPVTDSGGTQETVKLKNTVIRLPSLDGKVEEAAIRHKQVSNDNSTDLLLSPSSLQEPGFHRQYSTLTTTMKIVDLPSPRGILSNNIQNVPVPSQQQQQQQQRQLTLLQQHDEHSLHRQKTEVISNIHPSVTPIGKAHIFPVARTAAVTAAVVPKPSKIGRISINLTPNVYSHHTGSANRTLTRSVAGATPVGRYHHIHQQQHPNTKGSTDGVENHHEGGAGGGGGVMSVGPYSRTPPHWRRQPITNNSHVTQRHDGSVSDQKHSVHAGQSHSGPTHSGQTHSVMKVERYRSRTGGGLSHSMGADENINMTGRAIDRMTASGSGAPSKRLSAESDS